WQKAVACQGDCQGVFAAGPLQGKKRPSLGGQAEGAAWGPSVKRLARLAAQGVSKDCDLAMTQETLTASALPLSGVRVLDLTRVRAGPTAIRQLADWGADVIKIEEPVNPETETEMGGMRLGPDYQNLQRNKRSITLNLKDPEGVALFKQLVKDADVVAENYRPDVKTRLGIDYETLRAINPRLIYASISGFGQDGPYAKRPGYDQIVQGMGGLMSITGLPGQGPVRAGIAICDTTAGLYAAFGILMALFE